jgi:hypothetical protein
MLTRVGSDTGYGEMAREFSEGAAFRQIGDAVAGNVAGPPVGGFLAGRLLGDHQKRKREGDEAERWVIDRDSESRDGWDDPDPGASLSGSPDPRPVAPSGSGMMLRRTTIPMPAVSKEHSAEEDIIDAEIITVALGSGTPRLPTPMGTFHPAPGAPLLMLESGDDTTRDDKHALRVPNQALSASDTDLDDVHRQIVSEDEAREEATLRDSFKAISNSTPPDTTPSTTDNFDKVALSNAAAQLSSAAENLNRAALKQDAALRNQQLEQRLARTEGTFSVSGAEDVSAVLANTLTRLNADRATNPDLSFDNAAIANRITESTGTTPLDDRTPMSGGDMARYGMFMNKASALDLTGGETTRLIQDVKTSPDAIVSPPLRAEITARLVDSGNHSARSADTALDELEHLTRMLPDTLTVYGTRVVAVDADGELSKP